MPLELPSLSFSWYSLTMLLAIVLSAAYWINHSRNDSQLPLIYLFGLGCAFLGAKVSYMISEGWMHIGDDRWLHWMAGKSVTGALIGGFIGVELCKKHLGYQKITGDRFAVIVPIALILGRIGCLSQGCCQGQTYTLFGKLIQWPAVPVEIGFNLIAISLFYQFRRKNQFTYQHFHIYLIAYGTFRFLHEFLRATPKPFGCFSGYQLISLAMIALGIAAYTKRSRKLSKNT